MKAKASIEDLEEQLQISPDSQDLLDRYSQHLLKSGRITKTIEVCKHLLKLAPSNGDARARLAEALLRYGEKSQAVKEFQLSLIDQQADANKTIFRSALQLFVEEKMFAKALLIAQRAVSLYPKDKSILCLYGRTLGVLGRGDEAYEAFEKVVEIDANFEDLLTSLTDSVSSWQNPKLRVLLAAQQMSMGWYDSAQTQYKQALKAGVDDLCRNKIKEGQLSLIRAYSEAGKLNEALQVLHELDQSQVDITALRDQILSTVEKESGIMSQTFRRAMALGESSGDSVDTFWDWVKEVDWFAQIGKPSQWLDNCKLMVGDASSGNLEIQFSLIPDWDYYPDGDEAGVQDFGDELGALKTSLSEQFEDVTASFKLHYEKLEPSIKKIVEGDPGSARFHAPATVGWETAYTTVLIGEYLRVGERIPDILKLTWFLFASGRVVCGYSTDSDDEADRSMLVVY